jgi:aspartyl/asparaginyl beta-hydroxylase (cupin superfamily)
VAPDLKTLRNPGSKHFSTKLSTPIPSDFLRMHNSSRESTRRDEINESSNRAVNAAENATDTQRDITFPKLLRYLLKNLVFYDDLATAHIMHHTGGQLQVMEWDERGRK